MCERENTFFASCLATAAVYIQQLTDIHHVSFVTVYSQSCKSDGFLKTSLHMKSVYGPFSSFVFFLNLLDHIWVSCLYWKEIWQINKHKQTAPARQPAGAQI